MRAVLSIVKSKGQRSREKIMITAINCFSDKGFENTSAQDIANLCGVSQTTIFYHFKNKKVLFSEILKYVISNNRAIFEKETNQDEDPFDKLKLLLRSNVEWCFNYPEQASILLNLYTFAIADEEAKVLATKTIARGRDLVFELIKDISQDKQIKLNYDIEYLATIIQQYINAVLFQMLVRVDKRKVYDEFHLNLDKFLKNLILKNC
jgi:AcrR family transcriptional regulator